MLDCQLRQGIQAKGPLGPALCSSARNRYTIRFAASDYEDAKRFLLANDWRYKIVASPMPTRDHVEESGPPAIVRH